MKTIVNKTGRDLTIFAGKDDAVGRLFPADGPAAKNAAFNQRGTVVDLDGIPVTCATPTPPAPKTEEITGLPDAVDGVLYIVPLPVEIAAVALGRRDCLRMGPGRFNAGVQTGADGFQSSLVDFSA